MPCSRQMALSAEPRIGHFEKPIIDCTVRLMAVGAIFKCRRMLPQKWTTPFGVTGVAVFIHACLFQLGRIWTPVRIMAISTGELPFPQRHVRGAHQLSFSLQMTLTTNFGLGALGEKRRVLPDFRKLIAIGGFLHDRVAIDTANAAARVRARIPVSLDAALVTTETRFVLSRHGFAGVFAKRDQPADSAPAARGDVVTPRTVATFTSPFFRFVTRVEKKNFAHLCLGKFLKLFGVTSLANFVADVCSKRGFFGGFLGRFFNGFFFRGPTRMGNAKQEQTSQ